jgi:hypothetical protein
MENTPITAQIKQIIEIAFDLDSRVLEDYLYEMQSQSNLTPKVFFGMLKSEIGIIKTRDKELIGDLEKKGLMIFYKYHLLDILVDGIFFNECNKTKLTPKLARILGYDIELNPIELKKTKQPPHKKKTSYVWQTNPDKELPELYSLMIGKYKLIAPDTTIKQFTATFTGQEIESINPIKWHQDNASELLYFIEKLGQSNNIEHNPKRADYQKLKACFVKPDGSQFNEALKTLKQQIQFISPDKQRAIDELVSNF